MGTENLTSIFVDDCFFNQPKKALKYLTINSLYFPAASFLDGRKKGLL